MKVYVLTSEENKPIAQKLVSNIGIKTIKMVTERLNGHSYIALKKGIENADVVLAILDENFPENELKITKDLVSRNKDKSLVSIVINGAKVPKFVEEDICITCNSDSEEDVSRVKLVIENVCKQKRIRNTNNGKRERSKTSYMIIMTVAIELFAVFFVLLYFKNDLFGFDLFNKNDYVSIMTVLLSVVLAFSTLLTSYISIMRRRWHDDAEEEIESYSMRLKKAVISKEPESDTQGNKENEANKTVDALERMLINLEDIKAFYTWSQKQARHSFNLAIWMCVIGLAMIIVACVLTIVFKMDLLLSLIPAIGGIITEFFAGTALVVYKSSLGQLNHYHKALHEDERFLSSVNLLEKFSTVEAQDEMLREIIRSEIQMNLAELQEKQNIKTEK